MDIETFFALQRGRVQRDVRAEQVSSQKRFRVAKGDPESQAPVEVYASWKALRATYDPVYYWYKRLGILYGT